MFCFAERAGDIKRSSEHLLSRPVAVAFGIDREQGWVSRSSEGGPPRIVRLNGIKRRSVCRDCNSGWLNRLENDMTAVAAWFRAGDQELGERLNLSLRKWAFTRHALLSEIDGNAAEFADTDNLEEDYVVPLSSLARALYENDADAILSTPLALCRSDADLEFAWAFGHPTVAPEGRPQLGRFAATSVITLGALQLWISTPMIFDYEIYAPQELAVCEPNLRSRDLRSRSSVPSCGDLRVRFLEVESGAAAIDRLSQMSEDEIRAVAHSPDGD